MITDKKRELIAKYINGAIYGRVVTDQQRRLINACVLMLMHMTGETYANWSMLLQQRWLIADHWSAYHDMVATAEGWSLGYVNGAWQVVAVDTKKFASDEAAHAHVKMNEHDVMNRIYAQAIEAIVVGNFKGIGDVENR